MKKVHVVLLATLAAAAAGAALAQQAPTYGQPQGQKLDRQDLQVRNNIQQSVSADTDLSNDARNVRIVTSDGYVTLHGVVHSVAEKSAIEWKAIDLAGAGKVKNELVVVPQT